MCRELHQDRFIFRYKKTKILYQINVIQENVLGHTNFKFFMLKKTEAARHMSQTVEFCFCIKKMHRGHH